MVAYNFQHGFVEDIVARIKRGTIRNYRARHARPGERVQLYVDMRTKACRKIIPDPVCVGLDEIEIDTRDLGLNSVAPPTDDSRAWFKRCAPITVNGIELSGAEAESFARSDGFRPFAAGARIVSSHEFITRWWLQTHGVIRFHGVGVRWEDQE